MEYEIQLEEFQGPFDLLLHLVNKHEIDIFDIPISTITSQYLEYLEKMKERNLELTSAFILVASQLIEIKSKMLLPVEDNGEEEEEDPREALARRLYEYKIFKEISAFMKSRENQYLHTYYKDPEYVEWTQEFVTDVDTQELFKAFRQVLATVDLLREEEEPMRTIPKEILRVEDKILEIRLLMKHQERLFFRGLFTSAKTVQSVITTFLALLQLVKENWLRLEQEGNFSEIQIIRIGQV
ncbi:segregation/condensation protein A [Alkalibacter rhizosphaerae]|uniref:Segregation and condensation protein A n=1 Tax=Alkalibacter rhizosphaerae TaxID=2815577 RepID=A0A974XFK3_9FIRM|nr:segregation/condensation protein A [Alkalibacter rhizosphaerae]QSX08908.1 segregation/condensation protein A [Alkalibacter rhizosphaerae]